MLLMGKWQRKAGHTWVLLNHSRTHFAQVSLTKGGWRWVIANRDAVLIVGDKPTRRSRKARRQAQQVLARLDTQLTPRSLQWNR